MELYGSRLRYSPKGEVRQGGDCEGHECGFSCGVLPSRKRLTEVIFEKPEALGVLRQPPAQLKENVPIDVIRQRHPLMPASNYKPRPATDAAAAAATPKQEKEETILVDDDAGGDDDSADECSA